MNRRHYALGGLLVLIVLSGCLGGGGPSAADLNESATYDWNASANASITLEGEQYRSVYRITNQSTFEVFGQSGFGGEEPLSGMSALKFRYPNGTVVNASAFGVSSTRDRTQLELPAKDGQVAFTAGSDGKSLRTPVFTEGSYNVTLPPGTDVGIPFASHVVPGGNEKVTVDGRTRLVWEDIDNDNLVVRYYLDRDVLLFGGFLLIATVLGVGGVLYYYRQIRTLSKRREEHGLDIDQEDDPTDDGPPPGMR